MTRDAAVRRYGSWIEISRDAMRANLGFIDGLLGRTHFCSVVKGNAYGHGIDHFVPMACDLGVDRFAVFSAAEAERVLATLDGRRPELMIMGLLDEADVAWAVEEGLSFFVFDPGRLEQAAKAAARIGQPARVHVELETGMHRTGFSPKCVNDLADLLMRHGDRLKVEGLCTHFAGAEHIGNYHRIKGQRDRYRRLCRRLEKLGVSFGMKHVACSAAAVRYRTTHMDMARIGILQYGYFPGREVLIEYQLKNKERVDPLRRVIAWKTRVMDIHTVDSGQYVGYGTSFLTNEPTRIAVLPVGYANGFSRDLSNRGRALIRDQRFAVIGMVNMNMTTLDISEDPDIEVGDEVTLIGSTGDHEISVSAFGEFSHQVNYELLVRLPGAVPRFVVD